MHYNGIMGASTLIIVPAFNEEKSLPRVLQDLTTVISQDSEYTICVINDGSTDSTSKIAKEFGVVVLDLPVNIGVGGALRTGYRYAVENRFDRVIHFDADGQHRYNLIADISKGLDENDFVVGSRYGKEASYPITRMVRTAQLTLSLLLKMFHQVNLTDPTSGFRGSKGQLLEVFSRKYPSAFLADTIGSIILAKKHKFKIIEIFTPMNVRTEGLMSHSILQRIKYFGFAVLLVIFWREKVK
jgi:glycosyltransferase involved in cell wall biosynthesis